MLCRPSLPSDAGQISEERRQALEELLVELVRLRRLIAEWRRGQAEIDNHEGTSAKPFPDSGAFC